MTRILAILAFLESSGNSAAQNGDAVGILQIRPPLVADVNAIRRKRGQPELPLSARRCPVLSRVLAVEYIRTHCGPCPTVREAAALWRCGPTGRKNPTEGQKRYINRAVELGKQTTKE